MPLFGPPNIESMESRGDTAGLIRALSDKDLALRRKAVHALGSFTSQPAVMDALIAAMQERYIGSDVIHILGISGNPRALQPLCSALNSEYCSDAAEALGLLRDQRACPELRKIADHGGYNVRKAAINALSILGDPYVVDLVLHELKSAPFDSKGDLVQKLSHFNDPRIVDALLDLSLETGVTGMYSDLDKRINKDLNYGMYSNAQKEIKVKEEALQKEIRTTLKKIAPNSKEPLITAMQSLNIDRRKIASEILDSIGWQASSPDIEMKQWVINNQWENFEAAGSRAFDFLVATLQDSYPDSPGHAAQALAKLHDKRAVGPIIAALKGRISGWSILRIMESLTELDAVESISPMMEKLKQQIEIHDTNQVRYSKEVIGKCMLHFQGRAVAPLAQMLNGNLDLNRYIIEVLGNIGDPSAIPFIVPYLNGSDYNFLMTTTDSLKKLEWQPTNDDLGVTYLMCRPNWDKVNELGVIAAPALLGVFTKKIRDLYPGAAHVLKNLYHSEGLPPDIKAQILKLDGTEITPHNDGESLSTCTHTDEAGEYFSL
jgi:HEAT repeat protein